MSSSPNTVKTVVARVPYLNCAPFFQGLALDESPARLGEQGPGGWEWVDVPPRRLGVEAEAGRILAGPMALTDFLRLQDRFERLGPLGIAVRGRSGSTLLLSKKPIRQLDGSTIAVTEDSSTTALLLRLILEVRYELKPKAYLPAPASAQGGPGIQDAEAMLLIGDEALRSHVANRRYPYEVDLAFEWWVWQHLPMVFAVWAVRKDCAPSDKQHLSRALQTQLAKNLGRLDAIAKEHAEPLGMPAEDLQSYLEAFVYRLSQPEEQAITQFEQLIHAHHLL